MRALLDAKDRGGDKASRAQVASLLLRLSFYEDPPADVIARLVPLFQVRARAARAKHALPAPADQAYTDAA